MARDTDRSLTDCIAIIIVSSMTFASMPSTAQAGLFSMLLKAAVKGAKGAKGAGVAVGKGAVGAGAGIGKGAKGAGVVVGQGAVGAGAGIGKGAKGAGVVVGKGAVGAGTGIGKGVKGAGTGIGDGARGVGGKVRREASGLFGAKPLSARISETSGSAARKAASRTSVTLSDAGGSPIPQASIHWKPAIETYQERVATALEDVIFPRIEKYVHDGLKPSIESIGKDLAEKLRKSELKVSLNIFTGEAELTFKIPGKYLQTEAKAKLNVYDLATVAWDEVEADFPEAPE